MALSDGLILSSRFDGLSDHVGGRTWTNNNGATFVPGKIGNCLNCVRTSSQFLSLPDEAAFDFTTAFTVSLWFNAVAVVNQQGLLAKWNHAVSDSWIVCIEASKIKVFVAASAGDAGSNNAIGNTTLIAGQWYHLRVNYDGSLSAANRVKIWLNNALETPTITGTIPASLVNSTAELRCGNIQVIGSHLDGKGDELNVWNRALTDQEGGSLFAGGSGLSYPFVPSGLALIGVGV